MALCVILVMGYAAAAPPPPDSKAYHEEPHHLQKRAPKVPTFLRLVPLMAEGQGQGPPLAEHELMMNTPMNTGMLIEESFSGPLAVMGGLLILLSLGMAISYQASLTTSMCVANFN